MDIIYTVQIYKTTCTCGHCGTTMRLSTDRIIASERNDLKAQKEIEEEYVRLAEHEDQFSPFCKECRVYVDYDISIEYHGFEEIYTSELPF